MAMCAAEMGRMKDAYEDMKEAGRELQEAIDGWEDAGGFLDDSTLGDAIAVGGAVGACISNPFSWVVCGIGVLVGGGGVYVSESSRQDEIEAAEKAWKEAEHDFWKATSRYYDRMGEALDCLSHELTKMEIPQPQ